MDDTKYASTVQLRDEDVQPISPENPKARLSSILHFVRKASNDSEKLAGIMLVTKLFMTTRPDTRSIHEIYGAVGSTFVKRLLRSQEGSNTEDAKKGYLALGLSMLSCFSSDVELAMNPDLGKLAADVVAALARFQDSDQKELIDDALSIIHNLVRSETGSRAFLEARALLKLLENEHVMTDRCRELIDHFTTALTVANMWCISNRNYCKLLLATFLRLSKIRDSETFQIWKSITHLLSAADHFDNDILSDLSDPERKELQNLSCSVLMDMLKSRVPLDVKRDTLLSVYYIMNCFGVGWIYTYISTSVDGRTTGNLLALTLALAAVEIKMQLESPDSSENRQRENLESDIVAYFAIAEKVTIFLVNGGHDQHMQVDSSSLSADSGSVIKARFGLDDLMYSVMRYMKQKLSENCTQITLEDHVIVAAYRAVCAWLAEETEALRQEVKDLIPDMIRLAALDLKEHQGNGASISPQHQKKVSTKRPKLLEFLLPVLCHLSAEQSTRQVILKCKTHHILKEFLKMILKEFQVGGDIECYSEKLETLVGVFLNICITEPNLIRTDKVFAEVLDHLLDVVPSLYSTTRLKAYQLLANVVALGLVLSKHLQKHLLDSSVQGDNFLRTCLSFLVDTCPITFNLKTLPSDAESFSDLWCISFNNLTRLWKTVSDCLKLQIDLNIAEQMKLLGCHAKNSEVKLDHDVCKLIESFLETNL